MAIRLKSFTKFVVAYIKINLTEEGHTVALNTIDYGSIYEI